jgi:acetyl-CoA C-acetyltransferase
MLDSMVHDGLWDAYNDMHMGSCAEMLVSKKGYTREEQDQYSIRSYKRAQDAISKGFFENELVHVDIVKKDEEPGRAKFEKIPKIKPAFEKNGTITAANASKLNDGAAAVILMSKDNVKKYNLKPLAKVVAHCSFAHEPEWFTTAPSQVIKKILSLTRLTKSDIDIWEINEAFSAVTMSAIEDFELDEARVNIHGGAVALGHPIGASGARILTTLIHALGKSNKNLGLATLCIGGGEASAMIVEKL